MIGITISVLEELPSVRFPMNNRGGVLPHSIISGRLMFSERQYKRKNGNAHEKKTISKKTNI